MLGVNLFEQQAVMEQRMRRHVIVNDEYHRVCQPSERVADLLREAQQHGGIVAMKGEIICIMPRLIAGWTQVHGGWRRQA